MKIDFYSGIIKLIVMYNLLLLYKSVSCNSMPSFNYNYVILITNHRDNISKENPFRIPNNSIHIRAVLVLGPPVLYVYGQ